MMIKKLSWVPLFVLTAACTAIEPIPFKRSSGHIQTDIVPQGEIPQLVEQLPVLPPPSVPKPLEKYTVSVTEVPVKELLFALAREAKLNIDIAANIAGIVTMNAVEKTLPQILDRLSRQVELQYSFVGDDLVILPDTPYFKTYTIDYINIERATTSGNTIKASLDTAGSGDGDQAGKTFTGNDSSLNVTGAATHKLWANITNNILAILGETAGGNGSQTARAVIPIPEAGVITVKATAKQHALIEDLLTRALANARRQVLIQATIIEVRLTKNYQAGIDWGLFNNEAIRSGIDIVSTSLPQSAPAGTVSSLILRTEEKTGSNRKTSFHTTIRLLDEFGDVAVISSPQLMALNNQTAILKRVENRVFFTADADTVTPTTGATTTSVDIKLNSLAVGIIMNITPHIAKSGEITLHIRPIISRETGVNRSVPLPLGVTLPAGASNTIPETITQEMESVIRVNSGDIAVLGGLMEDSSAGDINQIPGTANKGILSALFKTTTKKHQKVELVIFLRPIIVNNPSLDDDLQQYQPFLNSVQYQKAPID